MPAVSQWHQLVAGTGGTYRSPGWLLPQPSVVWVQKLRPWPLVVNVATVEAVVLEKWRHQARVIAVGGVGASAGFAVLFGVLAQQFRRRAERTAQLASTAEALRSSEARVLDFVHVSSDWLWELDENLKFSWVSDSPMIKAMGIPDRIGMPPWDALNGDLTEPRWIQLRDDLLARRPIRDFRDEEVDRDGGHHHVSINGNPVFDADGDFVGYRGTGRDITSDVMAANELGLAKERAEAASRIKSEFLANMTHELRTPLNAIIGFSELIHDQPFGKIGANYVDYAREINTAGHHLLDMINDVLDLSKIEAGRYELADEIVELGMVVRSCVSMLKLRATDGDVRVENKLNGMRIALRGDARAIKQIVLNLLSNAIKFTPRGGSVTLGIERTDDSVSLVVSDSGIGIDPSALQSLCEPFKQADASISRKFGGSGLGLAICRKLLTMHGGSLSITSVPDKGTMVRAIFPGESFVEAVPQSRPAKLHLALSA
jgi:PAS domain S-box-containing protein